MILFFDKVYENNYSYLKSFYLLGYKINNISKFIKYVIIINVLIKFFDKKWIWFVFLYLILEK